MPKIRVMLVDDASVVRSMMRRALIADEAIDVVATAADGQMALDVLRRMPVDVVVLDIEMPVMDGMSALPRILAISPPPRVIMASTLTMRNAEISLRAMELGASDYIAKPSAAQEQEEFYRRLIAAIKALAPRQSPAALPAAIPVSTVAVRQSMQPPLAGALAIASSTGGPQALLQILRGLEGRKLRVPVFITQHMPPNFTAILGQHLSKASGYDCHEAADGELVEPGTVYIAPSDFHMSVERTGSAPTLRLDKNPQENYCRPSADPMLRSLARVYGDKLLVAVLTGLGADGARGAVEVVKAGGTVIAQDAASCVIYGMPKAVVDAKLTSAVLPLSDIALYLAKAVT